MADAPIQSSLSGLQGLLQQILGTSTDTHDKQSLTTQQLLDSLQNTSQNKTDTTTGTSATDQLAQLVSNLTGNQSTTTKTNADTSALQSVFAKQSAGISPDMLKAIFTEGAKQVPGLTAATANAVGARSSDNSALATSLRDLNTNLTSQAATLSNTMLAQSGTTAAQIADLTKSTTGNTTNTQTTNQNNSTTTNQTSQQVLQSLLTQLQNTTQNTNTNQQKDDQLTSKGGINVGQTAGAAGLAGLASLLGGSSDSTGLLAQLKNLIPGLGGASTIPITGGALGGDNSDVNPFDPSTPGFDTTGTGNYSNYGDPAYGGGDVSWFTDPQVGFADGGVVDPLKLTDSKGDPAMKQLMGLVGLLGAHATIQNAGGAGAKKDSTGGTSTTTASAPYAAPVDPLALNQNDMSNWLDRDQLNQANPLGPDGQPMAEDPRLLLQPDTAESLGFTGPVTVADTVRSGDANIGMYTNPDLEKYLSDKGLTLKTRYSYDANGSLSHLQAFDKDGKAVGKEQISHIDSDASGFGVVLGVLAGLAGGVAAGGLAAGAGYGAGTAVGGAATGAGGAFAGTLSQTADPSTAGKAALVGAVGGGLTAGLNVAGQAGVTNPIGTGAINGAVRGGLTSAITGKDPLEGIIAGGTKGAIPGVRKEIGMADGGVFSIDPSDPTGTADNHFIKVSGGEAILPKDVTDHLGHDFINSVIALFHTPAAEQNASV